MKFYTRLKAAVSMKTIEHHTARLLGSLFCLCIAGLWVPRTCAAKENVPDFCGPAAGDSLFHADTPFLQALTGSDSVCCPVRPEDMEQAADRMDRDSLAVTLPSEFAGQFFFMEPVQKPGTEFFKKPWVKIGLAALITGAAGYLFRKEADRAYASYMSADSPDSMNHYFHRAVMYDKVSSGCYIVCELNVCLAMWLSVRDSD